MKKIGRGISVLLLVLFIFNISITLVNASSISDSFILTATETSEIDANCDTVLGDLEDENSIAYLLQEVFKVMKFATPILVLVFSIIDFIKSISTQDKEILAKAIKRTVIRVMVGLVVFVIPSLLNFVFNLLGWYGTCGIK